MNACIRKKTNHKKINIFMGVFILTIGTIFLGKFNINGDQTFYINSYSAIFNENILDSYDVYFNIIGSKEYIHFIFTYIFSNIGAPKILFDLISNIILYLVLFNLGKIYTNKYYYINILILSNFYFYVLCFTTERLKLGIIFYALGILLIAYKKYYYSIFYIALSITSHVQMGIALLCQIFYIYFEKIRKKNIRKKITKIKLIAISIIIIIIAYFLYPHIISKFNSYYQGFSINSFESAVKPLIFLVATIILSKEKLATIFMFLILIFLSVILGNERINIMAYCIFIIIAFKNNKILNPIFILISVYMTYKSVIFLNNIYSIGEGFDLDGR